MASTSPPHPWVSTCRSTSVDLPDPLADESRWYANHPVDRIASAPNAMDRDGARRQVAVPVEAEVTQDSAMYRVCEDVRRNGGAGSVGSRERSEEDLHRLPRDRGAAGLGA